MRAGLLGARVSNVLGRLGQVRGARRARTLDRRSAWRFVSNQTKKDSGRAR